MTAYDSLWAPAGWSVSALLLWICLHANESKELDHSGEAFVPWTMWEREMDSGLSQAGCLIVLNQDVFFSFDFILLRLGTAERFDRASWRMSCSNRPPPDCRRMGWPQGTRFWWVIWSVKRLLGNRLWTARDCRVESKQQIETKEGRPLLKTRPKRVFHEVTRKPEVWISMEDWKCH